MADKCPFVNSSKKKGGGPKSTAPGFDRLLGLEVDRRSGVHEAAERVPGARIGVAVARPRRTKVRTSLVAISARDERRLLVEDVVHAQAEVEVVAEREGRCQIEIALPGNVQRWSEVVRTTERLVVDERFRHDLADIAPLGRDADAIGHLQADAKLMPPLRHRSRARHRRTRAGWTIKTRAVVNAARETVIDPVLAQIGPNEARGQRSQSAEAVAVGAVHVDAVGLDSPAVARLIGDEALRSQPERPGRATMDKAA